MYTLLRGSLVVCHTEQLIYSDLIREVYSLFQIFYKRCLLFIVIHDICMAVELVTLRLVVAELMMNR